MTLMKPPESKPPFYRCFSTFWKKCGGLCTRFLFMGMVRDDARYMYCEIKSHTTTTQI